MLDRRQQYTRSISQAKDSQHPGVECVFGRQFLSSSRRFYLSFQFLYWLTKIARMSLCSIVKVTLHSTHNSLLKDKLLSSDGFYKQQVVVVVVVVCVCACAHVCGVCVCVHVHVCVVCVHVCSMCVCVEYVCVGYCSACMREYTGGGIFEYGKP